MKYTIYNDSGEITKLIECSADHIDLQLEEGDSWVDGWYDMETIMFIDGVACEKPEPEEISREDKNIMVLEEIRMVRDRMLLASDWTQVVDSPLTDEQKASWLEYRQQLRELPQTYANAINIDSVTYPEPPTE